MIESAPGFLVAFLLPVLLAALALLSERPEKPAACDEKARELSGLLAGLELPPLELAIVALKSLQGGVKLKLQRKAVLTCGSFNAEENK